MNALKGVLHGADKVLHSAKENKTSAHTYLARRGLFFFFFFCEIKNFGDWHIQRIAEDFQINIGNESLAVFHSPDKVVIHIISKKLHLCRQTALRELLFLSDSRDVLTTDVVRSIRRFDLEHIPPHD